MMTKGEPTSYPYVFDADPTHIRCHSPIWHLKPNVEEEKVILDVSANGIDFGGKLLIHIYSKSWKYTGLNHFAAHQQEALLWLWLVLDSIQMNVYKWNGGNVFNWRSKQSFHYWIHWFSFLCWRYGKFFVHLNKWCKLNRNQWMNIQNSILHWSDLLHWQTGKLLTVVQYMFLLEQMKRLIVIMRSMKSTLLLLALLSFIITDNQSSKRFIHMEVQLKEELKLWLKERGLILFLNMEWFLTVKLAIKL